MHLLMCNIYYRAYSTKRYPLHKLLLALCVASVVALWCLLACCNESNSRTSWSPWYCSTLLRFLIRADLQTSIMSCQDRIAGADWQSSLRAGTPFFRELRMSRLCTATPSPGRCGLTALLKTQSVPWCRSLQTRLSARDRRLILHAACEQFRPVPVVVAVSVPQSGRPCPTDAGCNDSKAQPPSMAGQKYKLAGQRQSFI